VNWKSTQGYYPINSDEEPLIVTKEVSAKPMECIQEIGVRYLATNSNMKKTIFLSWMF